MKKNSKIYVSGHNGLVGSAIVRKLKLEGFANITMRTHTGLDLIRRADVEAFFAKEKPDYVFHAAAQMGGLQANIDSPADFIYANTAIALNVIHSAFISGVKKLLFIGSSWAYPKCTTQPIKEEALMDGLLEKTEEAYGVAKIAGIKLCEYYNRQYGANFISCMPGNIYGPDDNFDPNNSHVIPALIRKFAEAEKYGEVAIWGDGTPKREFLYVDDMADVCLFLMENYNEAETINVGTGEEVSIGQVTEFLREISRFEGKIIYDTSKPKGAPRKLLDSRKLLAMGWKPKTSLKEGLQREYHWYLQEKQTMIIQLLRPDFSHHDGRGSLTQLVREGYAQINVIASVAGTERGGHYHKKNSEAFFVIDGKFSLTVSKGDTKESYDFRAGDMFCIPPFVSHSFYFREYTLLVGMYSRGVENDDGTKDIYPDLSVSAQVLEDI